MWKRQTLWRRTYLRHMWSAVPQQLALSANGSAFVTQMRPGLHPIVVSGWRRLETVRDTYVYLNWCEQPRAVDRRSLVRARNLPRAGAGVDT